MASSSSGPRQRAHVSDRGERGPIPPKANNRFQEDPVSQSQTEKGEDFTEGDSDGAPAKILPPEPKLSPEEERKKRLSSIKKRVAVSWALVLSFALIIAMGHFYVALLILAITMGIFWVLGQIF